MSEALLNAIQLYLDGEALSVEQTLLLQQWQNSSSFRAAAIEQLSDPLFLRDAIRQRERHLQTQDQNWGRLQQAVQPRRLKIAYRWMAAAAVVLLMAGGVWRLLPEFQRGKGNFSTAVSVLPGSDKAILTLADGRSLALDSKSSIITDTGGVPVVHIANGQVSFLTPASPSAPGSFNTLVTPCGGQYQLLLPDGSKVWLNAASSIRFPDTFKKDRIVKVTGEAYFEVAKDKRRPFRVDIDGKGTVEVLGTAFNVNAYASEKEIRTTLHEGRVKVWAYNGMAGAAKNVQLSHPGEQAVFTGASVQLEQANLAQSIAWRNGLFSFAHTDLPTVMRQLSRWYNVEVVYKGTFPSDLFITGEIERTLRLEQVLKGLEKMKLRFSMESGRLTVQSL